MVIGDFTFSEVSVEAYTQALAELSSKIDDSVSFLQSPMYANVSQATKPIVCFTAEDASGLVACGLAIVYSAPLLKYFYLPYGPISLVWSDQFEAGLKKFFQPLAKQFGAAFLRLDPVLPPAKDSQSKRASAVVSATSSLQPRAEWLLDITPDEDSLWMSFHKHARYNVRLAERANADISINKPSEAPLADFLSLMQTTAKRDNFGLLNESHYRAYLDSMSDDDGFMTICKIDGQPAAAGLFLIFDEQVHYVFAGSSDDFRKIAPAYTVIWQSIKEAKRRGCRLFNFGGVSDDVKGQSLGGVSAFKKRFGGFQLDHANPIDKVYNQLTYTAFAISKQLRQRHR